MHGNSASPAGLESADTGGATDHSQRVRQHVSAAWLAIQDARRILAHSSRQEVQAARCCLVEAQDELEKLAEACKVGEGQRGG